MNYIVYNVKINEIIDLKDTTEPESIIKVSIPCMDGCIASDTPEFCLKINRQLTSQTNDVIINNQKNSNYKIRMRKDKDFINDLKTLYQKYK
jgi:hypothetical protein